MEAEIADLYINTTPCPDFEFNANWLADDDEVANRSGILAVPGRLSEPFDICNVVERSTDHMDERGTALHKNSEGTMASECFNPFYPRSDDVINPCLSNVVPGQRSPTCTQTLRIDSID